jgi:hypothetical protein
MLAASNGNLRVVAPSSQETRLLELLKVRSQEGSCPDCYRSGEAARSRPNAGGRVAAL